MTIDARPEPSAQNDYLKDHITLLIRNYENLTGEPLIKSAVTGAALAKEIYEAPFVLLSHDTQKFPVYTYANLAAQRLFGYSWDEFTSLESRYSAVTDDRAKREKLLQEVKTHGFIQNYEGVRIAKNGAGFYIKDVTVWNLHNDAKEFCGQAAVFEKWEFL